jgi:hypothetical protein
MSENAGRAFVAVGIVFFILGFSGRPFIGVGAAFFVIGLGAIARARRGR